MKWDDDLLLENDPVRLAERGQWQLAMYALHLSCGHTIYCRRIRASTIEDYVHAAATLLASFGGIDFRKDNPADRSMGHILAPVYRDIKHYESLPDRREPYDLQMHVLARSLTKQEHRDTLLPALVDGFEQGLCTGYRLSEWAQPAGRHHVATPQLNHLVNAEIRTRAIVPNDLRGQTLGFTRLRGLEILEYPLSSIAKVWVCFRTQKNGAHGEEKLFTRNPKKGGVCFVASAYRALERFQRLQRLDERVMPSRTPLSVYWDRRSNSVRLITATDIEGFMRKLAVQVYQLHPVKDSKDIRRWGTHSLRVGACVVLHAMGFSNLDIQWILRWKSMAFVAYLRNVAILATRQHQALDRAAAMPHLV